MQGSQPSILVVEDEPGIAETIHYALESDGFRPEVCTSARQAIERFSLRAPTLAILDVGLPDMSGFELFRRLQDLPGGKMVPMLFLTARSGEIDRVVGLELGADDYISKPFSPRELVARVRTILRRSERSLSEPSEVSALQKVEPPAQVEVKAKGESPFTLNLEACLVLYHGHELSLSRYEYGLLATLIQRPGRVFSRNELLELVWDDPGDSFDRTVDAHIKTLRGKLRAVRADEDPIRTLRGMGYALRQ